MSNWISVETDLPDRPTRKVIVYVKMFYSSDYIHVGTCRDGKWDVDDSRVSGITAYVTHWQPLPEPPTSN